MARDLTVIGLGAGALGVTPVIALAGRGFSRTVIRSVGPIAYRMAQRYGGNFASVFHGIARQLGFKVPRSAMRGVPRAAAATTAGAAAAAWGKLPKGAKKAVDQAVNRIRAQRKAPSKAPTMKPKGPR